MWKRSRRNKDTWIVSILKLIMMLVLRISSDRYSAINCWLHSWLTVAKSGCWKTVLNLFKSWRHYDWSCRIYGLTTMVDLPPLLLTENLGMLADFRDIENLNWRWLASHPSINREVYGRKASLLSSSKSLLWNSNFFSPCCVVMISSFLFIRQRKEKEGRRRTRKRWSISLF